MKVTKGELKIDRFMVPFRVYGESGQFFVCVNGVQQTMAAWKSVVNYFSQRYRIVLFDMPGQGRAKILSGPKDVAVNEQVQVLHQILTSQNASGKCIVAGASWGGIVVAIFASRYPSMVDKLILASFGIKTSEKLLAVIREGMRLHKNGRTDEVAGIIIKYFGEHLSASFKKRVHDQFKNINEEQFETLYGHGKLLITTQHINEVVDLSTIKARTLIINGAKDTILDLEDVATASTQISDCQFSLVPGVGHFLHNENEDVLRIYKDFLAPPAGLSSLANG